MNDSLWGRLSVEGQREVDRLITAGRDVQALLLMRECADGLRPGIYECMDLLDWRFTALREASGLDGDVVVQRLRPAPVGSRDTTAR